MVLEARQMEGLGHFVLLVFRDNGSRARKINKVARSALFKAAFLPWLPQINKTERYLGIKGPMYGPIGSIIYQVLRRFFFFLRMLIRKFLFSLNILPYLLFF